jgi:iron complex outermembrane recepter protein
MLSTPVLVEVQPALRARLHAIARALLSLAAAGSGTAAAPWAVAAEPVGTTLDPVVISVERTRQTSFDAPAAITAIGRDVIEGGGLQVNLSEALNRVPGITALNRQNYAQDLQISIRGFGSRSTFGIRGIRLLVDGIPASMPDGQGQASNVALSSAGRIEVLRGPLAQLYGNAAGGVVQVFTDMTGGIDGEGQAVAASIGTGSYGQIKFGARYHRVGPGDAVVLDASTFRTDGYRPNSGAQRQQINGKWQGDLSAATRVSVVFNSLDQPDSKDPLGLTRAAFDADPRQTAPIALQQNASKSVIQTQVGVVVEHQFDDRTGLSGRLYAGERLLDNRLSIPPAAQAPATSAGGIVEFARTYSGLGLQINHRLPIAAGRSLRLVGGVDFDRQKEDRQGYLNTNGVRGALKRNEVNTVRNLDVFGQGSIDVTQTLTATAGVRASDVRFESRDRFIATGNPDDSGSLDYRATNPVLGLSWRVVPALNLYANVGRGFETPTFTELAYRPGATGFNTALQASKSRHAEIGAKFKLGDRQRIDLALFDIQTENEIVVDTNVGGRSTFKNAGQTSRRGIELSHGASWGGGLSSTLSATVMQARFDESFVSGSGTGAVRVAAGSRLPGTPERYGFAELAWKPAGAWGGFSTAAELVATGGILVNDVNSDAAPSAVVLNWRLGFEQQLGPWRLSQGLRLDNATDRRYAGSVIVNDANQRFFEPALPRNWSALATARYAWR